MPACSIVVFLSNKVIVHSFTNTPQRLSVFETSENEAGVCALCPNTANALLAFPAKTVGQVQIVDIGNARKFSSVIKVGARDGRHRGPRGQRLSSALPVWTCRHTSRASAASR